MHDAGVELEITCLPTTELTCQDTCICELVLDGSIYQPSRETEMSVKRPCILYFYDGITAEHEILAAKALILRLNERGHWVLN